MNREHSPTFIGSTAKRDSLIYAKYALANRILMNIIDLAGCIKFRGIENPDPIDIIIVESMKLDRNHSKNCSTKKQKS